MRKVLHCLFDDEAFFGHMVGTLLVALALLFLAGCDMGPAAPTPTPVLSTRTPTVVPTATPWAVFELIGSNAFESSGNA